MWNCKSCGICCELLSEPIFGEPCPALLKDKTCKIYDKRPNVCRRKDGLTDIYNETECNLMKVLKEWRDTNDKKCCNELLALMCRGRLGSN